MFSRMLVTENKSTSAAVEIREQLESAATHGRSYHLKPSGRVEFPAAIFHNRNLYSRRSSSIRVYVNGKLAPQILMPHTFLGYVKIVFYVDDITGGLQIRGIKPKFYDICRLWGFGILGRRYSGRQEVVIA